MKVAVTLDLKFFRLPDGTVWTASQLPYSYWREYLDPFDGVRVIARVEDVAEVRDGWLPASGAGVGFAALPCYSGPIGYLRESRRVRRALRAALTEEYAPLLHVASPVSTLARKVLKARRQPYGVLVVNDPQSAFAAGAIDHPLRPILRWKLTADLRNVCWGAATASYVTNQYLQRLYPSAPGARRFSYSNVQLSDVAYVGAPKQIDRRRRLRVLTVGSLAQRYKGVDVLIKAVDRCVKKGLDLELAIAGEGRCRPELEELARTLELPDDRVSFLGQLPGSEAVRDELDRSDIFVLASRSEGLPRAMIEAMARGVPAVGTAVGGIPELIRRERLVPLGDDHRLSEAIAALVTNPERAAATAGEGLKIARRYHIDFMRRERTQSRRWLAELTREWQRMAGAQRPATV